MKPVAFAAALPGTIAEAGALLRAGGTPMAGGQSLGPMLNFRAARPDSVVRLVALPDLQGVEETAEAITIGAATTHAAIADGRTPDLVGGILAGIAAGIAYRAVRNRGTIGGSLCHADPAADWLTTLTALDAVLITTSRAIGIADWLLGPYRTVLEPGEILLAVWIPRPAAGAHWGYHKLCRKPGEFAHAMAAVLIEGAQRRVVLGALGAPPILLTGVEATEAHAAAVLADFPAVERHLHLVALRRALP